MRSSFCRDGFAWNSVAHVVMRSIPPGENFSFCFSFSFFNTRTTDVIKTTNSLFFRYITDAKQCIFTGLNNYFVKYMNKSLHYRISISFHCNSEKFYVSVLDDSIVKVIRRALNERCSSRQRVKSV